MYEKYPQVSVIIPVRNEQYHIDRCLDSVLTNDFPMSKLEILVIDGRSTDNTREIVSAYSKKYNNIKLIENPKIYQASALNIGINQSKGEIIIRMDAHTRYDINYIKNCVDLLKNTGADNVGGIQKPVGSDYMSRAIANVSISPFAVGDAFYRWEGRIKKNIFVDTVYLGCWLKSTLQKLEGFNEEFLINEDYELNYRIREEGGKILLSPGIKCEYYVRPSLKLLCKQYFRYGYWKVKTISLHPASIRWRQLVPPAFVIGLVLSFYMISTGNLLGYLIPLLYFLTDIFITAILSRKNGWIYFPAVLIIFPTIHISWGSGFIIGIFRWFIGRIQYVK